MRPLSRANSLPIPVTPPAAIPRPRATSSACLQPGSTSDERLDHFVKRDGLTFAGTHLIIDLWGAKRLNEIEHIEAALKDCVAAAGATLLHVHLHHFSPNGGVSGVAVLAESHISIHTWPECDYAALRSEEHTSELQSLMRISYAVFC